MFTISAPVPGTMLPILQQSPYIPLKALAEVLGINWVQARRKLFKSHVNGIERYNVNGKSALCIGILHLHSLLRALRTNNEMARWLSEVGAIQLIEFYIDYNKLSLWNRQ